MPKSISIDSIRLDAETQNRLRTNNNTITAYARTLAEAGWKWPFPPLDVFFDGDKYFLADGFHRIEAAVREGLKEIPCTIHKGTPLDAKMFGMTANDKHGMRLSPSDKRACVEWLLDHQKLTQKAIAEIAGVGITTVKQIGADRKPDSLLGKTTPPKQDGKGRNNPSTPISGDTDPFDTDPFDVEQPKNGKPPKKYDRSFWYNRWESALAPLVRLLDQIADNLGETNGRSHKAVLGHLENTAQEVAKWLEQ